MPFSTLRARGRIRRLSTALGAAALPLLLGGPLIYWQASSLLENAARDSVTQTRDQLEGMLDGAAASAAAVIGLSGRPCAEVEPRLRRESTASAFARSVNLVHDGVIYCTSLMGTYDSDEEAAAYSQGRLRLMSGNSVTPDRAVLIYRQHQGRSAVLVGIDGQHLVNLLQVNGRKVPLRIVVGEQALADDGRVGPPGEHADGRYGFAQTSPRYPFRVLASYPRGAIGEHVLAHYWPQWLLFVLLGALAGAGSYRLGLRSAGPGSELKRALEAGEFVPYYQPVVDARNGRWHGVETLMRWHHPSEGLVAPDQFIPLAEHLGLIVPMTRVLMQRIREDFASHQDQFEPGFQVSINVTAAHCNDLHLLDECREFLAAMSSGNIVLVLELTERQMISASEVTEQLFAELRRLGVRLAIDDFGTGHSSLAYLREFHVDYLKIDRSFVSMVGSHALSRHLLDNILDLAVRLQLGLIAEGVESAEQRDYLIERGVQFLQGYLFAGPMHAAALFPTLQSPPPHTLA